MNATTTDRHREFSNDAAIWPRDLDRRDFLRLMSASLALGGAGGCSRPPEEKIVPYVRAPEQVVPGRPLWFATSMPMQGFSLGLLAESHEGRPTKLEGNPDHPASLGATTPQAQASILSLYDPDRSQAVLHQGEIAPWAACRTALLQQLAQLRNTAGRGLRILTETVTSPTLIHQIDELHEQFPEMQWHCYEPVNGDQARRGAEQVFSRAVSPIYEIANADVIVALENDFLSQGPACVRALREFMSRRGGPGGAQNMNRLYVVESGYSPTGAAADHRLPLRPGDIERWAWRLFEELGVDDDRRADQSMEPDWQSTWVRAVADDLRAHRGSSLVLAGPSQPPDVHAIVHGINERLGNSGRTVRYIEPVEAGPADQTGSLRKLVEELAADRVDLLLILGANPVYTAPCDFDFAKNLARARQTVHLGLYADETARLCQWHVPAAHYLESWSDGRAYEGTAGIIQPLIAPLYSGKTAHDLLEAISAEKIRTSYESVRATWREYWTNDFETAWEQSLHDGVIAGTRSEALSVTARMLPPPRIELDESRVAVAKPEPDEVAESVELLFQPDPSIGDGQYANNGWLQELPKPITKLTWENAALLAPETAERLKIRNGDVVEIHSGWKVLTATTLRVAGHAEGVLSLPLGYGRTHAGRIANGIGFNAYLLRDSQTPWIVSDAKVRATGERRSLAITQEHHVLNADDSDVVHFGEGPPQAPESAPRGTLYPPVGSPGQAWGMSIDLTRCIGCNACVMACQAENNVPIVGKAGVLMGREMHWIRIDTYASRDGGPVQLVQQPMLCQHCEQAPCEVVCPVGATTHSPEGLNEMTYNRCIGTRYCSNNCPYKVRRFNFLEYNGDETPVLKLLHNPEVTVRSRGVMEKCTYCVQRINRAHIEAAHRQIKETGDGRIADGDVVTACQAACPAQAIVFGDIHDPDSQVVRLKAQERSYSVLEQLGTRPRTTYLAKLTNRNSDLDSAADQEAEKETPRDTDRQE